MDPRSGKNTTESGEQDLEFYVKHEKIPVDQIRTILKHRKMSDDKVDEFVSKVVDSRSRISKYAKKFIAKVDQHYGVHDIPTIIKKATRFSEKHKLSTLERDAIISAALKDEAPDVNPIGDLKHTEMSKFMGIEAQTGQVLNLQSKDYAVLNEITKLYEYTRNLHADVKNQVALYRDCAPEAYTGKYDKTKHNLSTHIHPVVVAMFFPKIQALEKRMLHTNVGRIVLERAMPYLERHVSLYDNVLPGELEDEWALTFDITRDPNSLAYFSEDTPITNMLKRQKIQIELWKNVLSLRQGKYFSTSYEDDGINGLLRTLGQYDWSFFDSPDMFHNQDEGSVFRKLLSVFSLRPTFARVASLSVASKSITSMMSLSHSSIAKTSFFPIPIINVRLPTPLSSIAPSTSSTSTPALRDALSQADWFIEHKSLVPKSKDVIHTTDVAFFYVNRRYQSVDIATLRMSFTYTRLPYHTAHFGQTTVNDTSISVDRSLKIGSDILELRSVVAVGSQKKWAVATAATASAPIQPISFGSTTYVLQKVAPTSRRFYRYQPMFSGFMYTNPSAPATFVSNDPFMLVPENAASAGATGKENFDDEVSKYGSVFIYCKN